MVVMVRTKELLPMIAEMVPLCPFFTSERCIREAAIEFSERSRAWRHVSTHAVIAGEHTMIAPDHTAIHEIEYAQWNGAKLTPIQFSTLELPAEGRPAYITQVSPGAVQLLPFEAGSLEISVFLKPLATSAIGTDAADPLHDPHDVIPDFYVSIHGTTIKHGALSLIFAIPNQVWSDPQRAAYHEEKFRRACDGSFRENLRGQQRAPSRTTARWM